MLFWNAILRSTFPFLFFFITDPCLEQIIVQLHMCNLNYKATADGLQTAKTVSMSKHIIHYSLEKSGFSHANGMLLAE